MSAGSILARWLGGREPATPVPAPEPEPEEPVPASRRERALGGGEVILREVLAEKVLHGWIQNRNQVLFPLTLNLRTMSPERAALLASMMAIAALAGADAEEAAERGQAFLRATGGNAAVGEAFRRAVAQPPALSGTIGAMMEAGMTAYAYVAALAVVDARDPAGGQFLEYLVLRLGLPAAVVRSAHRRFRR